MLPTNMLFPAISSKLASSLRHTPKLVLKAGLEKVHVLEIDFLDGFDRLGEHDCRKMLNEIYFKRTNFGAFLLKIVKVEECCNLSLILHYIILYFTFLFSLFVFVSAAGQYFSLLYLSIYFLKAFLKK
jgi:hypothetical protein